MTQDEILAELDMMIAGAVCNTDRRSMQTLRNDVAASPVTPPPGGGTTPPPEPIPPPVTTPPPEPTPEPPPTGSGSWNGHECTNFNRTYWKAFDWATPGNMILDTGAIGSTVIAVLSFTTPDASVIPAGALMNIGVAQFPGDQAQVDKTIAVKEGSAACDLKGPAGFVKKTRGATGSLYMAYGPNSNNYGVLKAGTQYFVSVANMIDGKPTTSKENAGFRVEIIKGF